MTHYRRASVAIAALVGAVLVVAGALVGLRVVPIESSWFIGPLLAVAGCIVMVGAWRGARMLRGRRRWANEARDLGLRYDEMRGQLGLPGLLFRSADHSLATNVVDALDAETPFLAGDLSGTYGEATSAPRRVAGTFVAIPMDRDAMDFVLVSTRRSMIRAAGLVPHSGQEIVLEGDFPRSFSLYGPVGAGVEARVVFTPDLMSLLVDAGVGCDIEIVGGWIFVYGEAGRYGTSRSVADIGAAVVVLRERVLARTRAHLGPNSSPDAVAPGAVAPGAVSPDTVSPDAFAASRAAARSARVTVRSSGRQILASVAVALLALGSLVWLVVSRLPA